MMLVEVFDVRSSGMIAKIPEPFYRDQDAPVVLVQMNKYPLAIGGAG